MKTLSFLSGLSSLVLLMTFRVESNDLLFYAPMDRTTDAAIALGDGRNQGGLGLNFVEGIRGQALILRTDCRYAAPGNFRPEQGTVAVWVRPHWDGNDPAAHYIFCIYGGRNLTHAWAVNRWNIAFGGGKCTFTIFSQVEGKTFSISAPIQEWKAEHWHHIAAAWKNVNSGRPDAEMHLYLDGALVGRLEGQQIDVGPTDDVIAIGRDQDASPDYGNADFDDLFIYGRPLSADEIAAAVQSVKGGLPYTVPSAVSKARAVRGWWNAAWPHRAEVIMPAEVSLREGEFVQCPVQMGSDLACLGLASSVNPESIRVVEEGQETPLPARVEDDLIEWQTPLTTPAGRPPRFHLYFQTYRYQIVKPLLSQRLGLGAEPPQAPPPPPDYATTVYGKPWNFDDGSFCGIDQWGDRPQYLRNRKVENGILSMDVEEDPYFIWGDMWGQVAKVNRKVAIDLDKFPILEMKIRQSVAQADWELYGRVGTSDNLLHYKFPVTGTGWQRIHIDLKNEARWAGVLSAFRIDPTCHVKAHVEIDWIRLTAVVPVQHGHVETLGEPNGRVKCLETKIPHTTAPVGSQQEVTITAAGETQPVSGQPILVVLEKGSGGELAEAPGQRSLALGPQARRGITDKDGRLRIAYIVSRRAGKDADTLAIKAEFTDAPEARTTITALAGPPHHYRVEPTQVAVLKASDPPLALRAELADQFDNPINETRAVTWTTDEGGIITPLSSSRAIWKGDETRRWVYHVRVKDDQGLIGQSAPICLLPEKPRQDPIVLGPNGYFRKGKDGPAWLPLGGFYANWVGLPEGGEEGRKVISFVEATEEQLSHWLDFLAAQGVTAMRFMLRAHTPRGMEPMDVIGRVNMPLFAKVLRYMDLARKHDIRFMLTIHEDYTKPAYYNKRALETFCIPYYEGEDLDALPPHQRRFIRDRKLIRLIEQKYTDPDVMACQDQYTRELAALLKDNPQLFAWEFENEMVNCPREWANHMASVIRSVDPVTPICASHGGGGLFTADPFWWTHKTSIDFYTYHLYPQGTTSEKIDYGAAVDVLTCYGRMAGVCMLGESSGDEFSQYPRDRNADRRYIMRDIIWFSLVNGNPGCFFWNARGFEVEQFRLARKIAGALDWRDWRRQRPDIGILAAHPLDNDKYYRTPEGRADYAMMGQYAQHYLSTGVDFDFTMDGRGYPKTAGLKTFAPPSGVSRVSVTPGWQIRAHAREGFTEGLAYVRNFAGVRRWQQPKINMYLRERKPAPLKLRLNLPIGEMRLTAIDLDTGQENKYEVAGNSEIDLGITEHDWALVWQKKL